ncbi:MAG: zinc ribbon domain-containing protein [Candidatus Helarchaeota archaeon]
MDNLSIWRIVYYISTIISIVSLIFYVIDIINFTIGNLNSGINIATLLYHFFINGLFFTLIISGIISEIAKSEIKEIRKLSSSRFQSQTQQQQQQQTQKQEIIINLNPDASYEYCAHCGKKIPTNSTFCKFCGEKQL